MLFNAIHYEKATLVSLKLDAVSVIALLICGFIHKVLRESYWQANINKLSTMPVNKVDCNKLLMLHCFILDYSAILTQSFRQDYCIEGISNVLAGFLGHFTNV